MARKPSFETSVDVQKLVEHLPDQKRVSYKALSKLIGRELEGRDRYVLASARRILERRGVIFECERGYGLVRANNGQVANLSTTVPITKIKRVTRRAKKREKHVDVQALTADERLAFAVKRVVLNTIARTTLKSFASQIRAEIEKTDGDVIAVSQLVALPRLKKGGKTS